MSTTMTIPKTKSEQFQDIPAEACWLKARVEFGDNGEGASTIPIRLVARSPQPIEHWYWGSICHRLDGAFLRDGLPVLESSERINFDYSHDEYQVIGFGNKFQITEEEGLIVTGAITPMPDSYQGEDMARHVVHKARLGVPYEASINFGGSGLKFRLVDEGEVYEVNGFDFEGPGIVVDQWPLRNVAICSLGADGNTSSALLKDSGERSFKAELINFQLDKGDAMPTTQSDKSDKVSIGDLIPGGAFSDKQADKKTDQANEPAKPATADNDVTGVDLSQADTDTAAESDATASDVDTAPTEFDRSEGPKFIERFGETAGPLYFTQGLSYVEALETHVTAQGETISELKEQLKIAQAQAEGAAADDGVTFVDGDGAPKEKYNPFADLDDEE